MQKFYKKQLLLLLVMAFNVVQPTSFRFNWLQPYDTLINPLTLNYQTGCFQVGFIAEGGIRSAQGYDTCGDRVNVLDLWNVCGLCDQGIMQNGPLGCDQDALAMLDGFPAGSTIDQFKVMLDADDDGVRGHLAANADLKLNGACAFSASFRFLDYFKCAFYLPFYSMRLDNVAWQDKTQNITAADVRVIEKLTGPLFSVTESLGSGLDIGGWKRTGLGDLSVFVEGSKDFKQMRPFLRNVCINGRVGVSLPMGVRADPDRLFSVPFGYNGAFGIVWGGGLDLTFGCYFKTGFDVQLTNLFGNTRSQRIKTDVKQTELLLLQKVDAYTNWGLTQRFNLYAQLYEIFGGFSLLTGYQFIRSGDDRISFSNCSFSTEIANTARSLEESTMHQIIVNASYNVGYHMSECACYVPYVSVIARLPVLGRNVALIPTVGVTFSLNF